MTDDIKPCVALPIETKYRGCRFRSRLEARWAVFFNALGVPWEYEPQGFRLSTGRMYLPDFLLPQCATWIEVKGSAPTVDMALLRTAGLELPRISHMGEAGPKIMLLGPIPEPRSFGDYGWPSWDERSDQPIFHPAAGFGLYHKNNRLWHFDDWTDSAGCSSAAHGFAVFNPHESSCAQPAYAAARAARFEHGERG